ncbi:anthranilate synthase component I family protein, partial [Bacteroidota bacterium]
NSVIDPLKTFIGFNEISPAPFSCYYKLDDKYLLSASPERFIKKSNNKIISQPIKGTIKRSLDNKNDLKLKTELFNDPKERAENVMIVDLVRNDLSRTANKASVKVEELFGIYSFKQVHQMISTVVSEVNNDINIIDVIKNAFPMGSMTGAPKVRAMRLIEQYEKTKRGLYSGSVGYITPDNNFDFNVVIRSILYNQSKNYVSFTVGGAITSLADPDKEYEECMVKAEAMLKVFS